MSVLFLILMTLASAHQTTGFTKDTECGKTKGCYSDCKESGCEVEVTWKADGDDHLIIGIRGKVVAGSEYVAVGFSDDKKMGGDSVLACISNGNDISITHRYNDGNDNIAVTNGNEGLSKPITTAYYNGVLTCSVRRQTKVSNSKIFDLNKKWYVFLARGPISGGKISQHNTPPDISPSALNFQDVKDSTGQAKNLFIKIHGSVMVAAWIFCASIGIVLARFYKPVWGSRKFLGEKVWFTLHRALMVLCFGCCVAGFVIIFVEVETWSHLKSEKEYLRSHPYIGVVIMALALFNPIGALMRCHPDDKYRFIFNWGHWFMGTCAHTLAIVNIIFGVRLSVSKLPEELFYVTVAYAIYQILFEVCLEVYDCCHRSGSRSSSYEMQERKAGLTYHTEETETHGAKKILLGLHVLIITGFTAAIIVMIVIN